MQIDRLSSILDNLDLSLHVESFSNFFSRPKPISMQGDQESHYRYIKALDELEFKAPPKVEKFDSIKGHLSKQGILTFGQIFEIIKVVRYFRHLKNAQIEGLIGSWLEKIVIPVEFSEIESYFDERGNFNEYKDEQIQALTARIKSTKESMSTSLRHLIFSAKLKPYLVDTQIHYINDEEALMVRGGFNHVLKGDVIGRSGAGFFYVAPDSILKQKQSLRGLRSEKEAHFYRYAQQFSASLLQLQLFIKFIDKEFERFDNYQARIFFARQYGLSIVKTSSKSNSIVLSEFKHPALHNAKSVDVNFSKNILMITGVNAGGKTMLLKSILSATLMAKYLVPISINSEKSEIANFKRVEAIIDDPQNVKNDISTFAGRMVEFSKLFSSKQSIVGVDEIELGTDSDEAAALFKIVLDELVKRGQKIVVTTHHKRLASLMADRDDVQMMAALYDEERRLPTYEFLDGVIGKSYAFETALRYGISHNIVNRAKEQYGKNYEKLSELIERGSALERELKAKHKDVDERVEKLKADELHVKSLKERLYEELQSEKRRLQQSYDKAIGEAKSAASQKDNSQIHRKMNEAKKYLPPHDENKIRKDIESFSVGDKVKYRKSRGNIVSLKAKEAIVEIEGMRVRVKLHELKKSYDKTPKTQVNIKNSVEKKSGLTLDLHGLRAEEANEKMDKFLSDALISGFDEVVIYHGIGTGKLSYAVKKFLEEHPKVVSYTDAPIQLGGYGAKVVQL
ncbi:MAG: endonuclease MutS2 [Campylobacterota bacterium]|nr:endonuclease MutS2 [Campylobacterota bacterium]